MDDSYLLAMPFEIRKQIWRYAMPPAHTTTAIHCCRSNQDTAIKCLLPFASILDNIDPLHIIRHAPQLPLSNHKFIFCSKPCISRAMRLSTPQQRAYMLGSCIAILYTPADVAWVRAAADADEIPRSITVHEPIEVGKRRIVVEVEDEDDDGEGRIDTVRRGLFRTLERMNRKYFGGVADRMTGTWTGEHGGFGWVEMQL